MTERQNAWLICCIMSTLVLGLMVCVWPITSDCGEIPYPDKPVELIVPWPAGGAVDIPARLIADFLEKKWGKPITVINKPGGAQVIGTQYALSKPANGYTVFADNGASSSVQSVVVSDLPYKLEDRTFICKVVSNPCVYSITAALPYKTLKEFGEVIKQKPAEFSFASGGPSSVADLAIYQYLDSLGVDVNKVRRVRFKGGPEMLTAVAGGHVQMTGVAQSGALPFITAGKTRAIGLNSKERSGMLPDVPTSQEQGFNALTASVWVGISGPKNMPEAIVKRWNNALNEIVNTPEFQEKAKRIGVEVSYENSETMKSFVFQEARDASRFLRETK